MGLFIQGEGDIRPQGEYPQQKKMVSKEKFLAKIMPPK